MPLYESRYDRPQNPDPRLRVGDMRVHRCSDAAFALLAELLPDSWILHSIQITELDDYSVLLRPRGPMAPGEYGRIYGVGHTIADALHDSVTKLELWLTTHARIGESERNRSGSRADANTAQAMKQIKAEPISIDSPT